MVAEPWIIRMGNQVSNNLKHAFSVHRSKKIFSKKHEQKKIIGILSFEVANIMSKTVNLHKSLTDLEISRLKNEILKSEGLRTLVSSNESYLFKLAVAEKLDDINRIASVVSRLGKRCVQPALQGFEHVYADIMIGAIDARRLGFNFKDMGRMIRKMERYVNLTSSLYNEMEVLNELEKAWKKSDQNQREEDRVAFEQKLIWQGQDVRHLMDISLWSQTYDKIVGSLARMICTIYIRICVVFGENFSRLEEFHGISVTGVEPCDGSDPIPDESCRLSDRINASRDHQVVPETLHSASSKSNKANHFGMETRDHINFSCRSVPGMLLMECLNLGSSTVREERNSQASDCCNVVNGLKRECYNLVQLGFPIYGDLRQSKYNLNSRSLFGSKSKLMVYALPSTVGGSALALHYANIIIVIEKLLGYPHLVSEDVRDDLYQMLPTSLRTSLRTNLKPCLRNFAIYDAPLVHDWKETLENLLGWLAPLAHNMIRWQTERTFEQQQIISGTNILLLQTLYFADREKTEAAICDLLVGLNYIFRYEQQQSILLDCTSSFGFEWQLQN